jgi:aspartate aminotransferase
MVDAFHSRRDLVVGLLKEIPGVKSTFQKELLRIPRRFFFLRKNIERNRNQCNGFSMYLLAEANVATVTGDAFEILTVRFCNQRRDLERSIKRIKDALAL